MMLAHVPVSDLTASPLYRSVPVIRLSGFESPVHAAY